MIDKRLMKEMPEARQYIFKQVGMQWINLLCNILFVFLLAHIIKNLFDGTITPSMIVWVVVIVVCLIIIRVFVTKKASYYAHLASCEVKDAMRFRLYQKLLLLKNDYSSHVSTSELVQLSVEGIDQLETYFGRYLPQFFYSMLAPITLFFVLVWMDIRSALVLLVCVPFIPLSIIAVQKIAKRLLSKYWGSYASLGDSFLENLQGLTTLKIYQSDGFKNEEMNKEAEKFRNITMKVLTMQLNSVSVMDIIAYGGAAVGSIVAISGFQEGNVSLVGVICIILLSSEFFIPLRLLGSLFHIAMNGITASSKIFKMLDIEQSDMGKTELAKGNIAIEIEHLNFAYNAERQILKNISLKLNPQQFVSIIGESGSGKSTIAKLIVGLEKDYEGSLFIQGQERRTLKDESFYEFLTYITHKPTIFKGTVRENLRIAKPNATDEEMLSALKSVNLDEFLMSHEGLDTSLLEQGANFSGGQNQRLSLARALLRDSEVYIFDEATSNIDVESELVILDVIKELAVCKTILMITHRLSSVVDSDCIYVLKQGEIAESGTHKQLYDMQGLYANMFEKQRDLENFTGDTI